LYSGENRRDHTKPLDGGGEIVAEQLGERADFGMEAHRLQLTAAIKLERGLERARHLKCSSRHACNGHEGMGIELEDFLGFIRENSIAGGGSMVSRDDDALRAMKRKDGRRLQRFVGRNRTCGELGERVFWQQGQE